MSSAPSITEKLSNVQHMPSLIAATVASDKPTDLYLIRDIIKMSYESIQTRVFLQKYLTNLLLTSKNVLVKIKVLKLVVSLLEEGHPDFHRNLQKAPESFKESARIKTTDITMAADCGRIRDLANKILDRLYDEPPDERQCPYGIPSAQRGTSSGSTGSSGGSVGGGVSIGKGGGALGGRIQGFGTSPHPSQQQSSLSEQFTNAVGTILGSAPGIGSGPGRSGNKKSYDEKYATLEYIPTSSSVGRMGGGSSQTPPSNRDTSLPYSSNTGSGHVRGRPGGGWDDTQEEEEEEQVIPVTMETSSSPIITMNTSVDSEQERRLVEDITTPGGIRVAPLKEDLKKFITRCKNLDCLSVVEFLRLKLQSDNSQVVSKALFVLESLVRSDIPDIISYLDLTLDELTTLSTSSQHASIKAKSTKILYQLNAVESMSSKDGPLRQHSNSDTGNLLEMGGTDQEKEQSSSEINSIFSGLKLTDSDNPPQSKQQPISKKKQTSHKPVTNNNTDSSSLLEGLTFTDTPSASLSGQSQSLKDDLVDFNTDNEAAVLDPLLSTSSTNTGSGDDPLGGLLSLEEDTSTIAQTTTNLSSGPLMPTPTPLVSNNTPLGGVTIQTPPTLSTMGPYMTTTQPSVILGPVISGPPGGGLQQQVPVQQQYQYSSQQMYQSSMNRPVQLMPQTQTTAPAGSESSGFDFLSKGKPGAFDFVQDEIKAARGKN